MLLAAQDFAIRANVKAGVVAKHDADVGGALGDLEVRQGLVGDTVHDEDEVGRGVEAVAEEVAQVVAGVRSIGEGVEYESAPWVVGGRGEGSIEDSARGIELAFGYVRIWGGRWE